MTTALLAIALVMIPRVGGFAYIPSLRVSLKWTLLSNQQFILLPQPPTDFYRHKLGGFIFLALEPWTVWSALGLGSLTPEVSLLFFIHHM